MPWRDEYLAAVHDIQRGLGEQVDLPALLASILWHAGQYFGTVGAARDGRQGLPAGLGQQGRDVGVAGHRHPGLAPDQVEHALLGAGQGAAADEGGVELR